MEIKGSYIGKDTKIQGTLSFSGDIRIDGHVDGALSGGTTGRILISEKGYFEGKAEAERIEIRGVFRGDAKVDGFFVYAPGVAKGCIQSSSIFVEDGAKIFNSGD
ncbi:bactofilin family protein [Desulforegula conservatrix]|uniref:bactofilin family protein n=1 Tax=Desulforegula conservatrix TaxID=153026 RepID=UPI00041A7DAF|nr:polymer-forming cytoskeletal protein [Desulforegula conservatrix]